MNWKKLFGLEKTQENDPRSEGSKFPDSLLNFPTRNKLAWELMEQQEFRKAYLVLLEVAFINGQGKHSYHKYKGDIFLDAGRKIVPATINGLKNSIKELGYSEFQVHKEFVALNTLTHLQFDFPYNPQDIWHDQLKNKLFK